MSLKINPLANPRGVKLTCEICKKPAFSQCTQCKVTFYCGRDHQAQDWDGIHSKVCSLLATIRKPKPFLNSAEERKWYDQEHKDRQKQLVSLTSTEARRMLYDGQHQRALPAAQLSLRSSIELYGSGRIEVIPSLVVLAEVCIGIEQLSKAEQYLSQAKWSTLQSGVDCSPIYRSLVSRVLGRLHIVRGDHKKAMVALAEDVYNSTLAFGSQHIKTSGGYFYMGKSFLKASDVQAAAPLFAEVVSIWHAYISVIFQQAQIEEDKPDVSALAAAGRPRASGASPFATLQGRLDEAEKAEVKSMLEDVVRTMDVGVTHFSTVARLHAHYAFSALCGVELRKRDALEHCKLGLHLCDGEKEDDRPLYDDLITLQRFTHNFL